MNSIDILTKIYKPYKVSVKGNTKIFNCTTGNYVIKNKKDKNIKELYKYLNSRSFKYYPKLIEDNRDEVNVFEYVEDNSIDNEQKLMDLINEFKGLLSINVIRKMYDKYVNNEEE